MRDGGSAPFSTHKNHRTYQGPQVDAGMFVEADVLGCQQGMNNMRGDFMKLGIGSVLEVEFADDLTIGCNNFGCQVALWVFEVFKRRHFAQTAGGRQEQNTQTSDQQG